MGLCWETVAKISAQIAQLKNQHQWVIMVGGGNFFRGRQLKGLCETNTADSLGMVATYLNGLALRDGLTAQGVVCDLWTAHGMDEVGKIFNAHRIQQALGSSEVIICCGGLGHGAASTDTAAFVRAYELNCHMILKATNVDGLYSDDPKRNPLAQRYESLTYGQALEQKLAIMDFGAMVLGLEHKRPCLIFSLEHGMPLLCRGECPYSFLYP